MWRSSAVSRDRIRACRSFQNTFWALREGRDPRGGVDRRLDRAGRPRACGSARPRLRPRPARRCGRRSSWERSTSRRRTSPRLSPARRWCSPRRPWGRSRQTVPDALAHAGPDCVISDVGSTKLALEDARSDARFIGGHPLAGAETRGRRPRPRESVRRRSLVPNRVAALPTRKLYERLSALIERLGAQPAAGCACRSRPPDGLRLTPSARARQRAGRAGPRRLRARGPHSRKRPPVRPACGTPSGSPAPTPRSGPTSTSPTARR